MPIPCQIAYQLNHHAGLHGIVASKARKNKSIQCLHPHQDALNTIPSFDSVEDEMIAVSKSQLVRLVEAVEEYRKEVANIKRILRSATPPSPALS